MCGRFTLTVKPARVEEAFGLFGGLEADLTPRYNVAPTQNILVLKHAADAEPTYCNMRWGLVPFWADDLKIGNRLLNARADGIADKPAFRAAFKRRRCLILADGFYEWKTTGTGKKAVKQPYHIHYADRRPFAFAGLWEKWDKGEKPIESCTIITTDANDVMRPLHERMPVILDPKDYRRWISPEAQDPAVLLELLRPAPPEGMVAGAVSSRVNNSRFEDPACLEPAEPSA
jgi:putative SOS response-associated peptidase YedK